MRTAQDGWYADLLWIGRGLSKSNGGPAEELIQDASLCIHCGSACNIEQLCGACAVKIPVDESVPTPQKGTCHVESLRLGDPEFTSVYLYISVAEIDVLLRRRRAYVSLVGVGSISLRDPPPVHRGGGIIKLGRTYLNRLARPHQSVLL